MGKQRICYALHFSPCTVHTFFGPQAMDSESSCVLLENGIIAFQSLLHIFVLLDCCICKASIKFLVKHLFDQFLAIYNAKVHRELLVCPSDGNIRQVQISYISILLTPKGFYLIFEQCRDIQQLSTPGKNGCVISDEKSIVHISYFMGQRYAFVEKEFIKGKEKGQIHTFCGEAVPCLSRTESEVFCNEASVVLSLRIVVISAKINEKE